MSQSVFRSRIGSNEPPEKMEGLVEYEVSEMVRNVSAGERDWLSIKLKWKKSRGICNAELEEEEINHNGGGIRGSNKSQSRVVAESPTCLGGLRVEHGSAIEALQGEKI
ncbi:hypothetical protein BDDG_01542 [Blastomyces dermatitidis ATCC 18188]|uniref:Uncharacterized protein n=2 Tax=Ajellomyces dermatitidis TaxID=5039 RepID=F2T5U2_AJEDA|nr:hypothetical protein BDDG_01542 [Blastomyces dermatitidis ATCC 18188]